MENRHSDMLQVVHDYMSDPETAWTINGDATFLRHRDDDAEVSLDHSGGSIVAQGGAVRITINAMTRLAPVECLNGESWAQAGLLCLRNGDSRMARRAVLTEMGSDMMAVRPTDRLGILFDLGRDLEFADCCIRTSDDVLCETLRKRIGEAVADDDALFEAIKEAGADYVTMSRLGRVETFGAAPSKRKDEPVFQPPAGYDTCMAMVLPLQGAGAEIDEATYGAFRVLSGIFGEPAHRQLKQSVMDGIRNGDAPESVSPTDDAEHTVIKVTLRQMERIDGASENLKRWKRQYER
jgi:hypothetical protein